MSSANKLIRENTIFFVCDLQHKLSEVTYAFDEICGIARKMARFAQLFGCPILATEHWHPKGYGHTPPEVDLEALGDLNLGTFEKTTFSMMTEEVTNVLKARPHLRSVVLFGIETHVCVLQTALDLLKMNYDVYVVADGVSSGSKYETPFALARIRTAGGCIDTSDSIGFQLIRDSSDPNFETFSSIVKEESEITQRAAKLLLKQGPV